MDYDEHNDLQAKKGNSSTVLTQLNIVQFTNTFQCKCNGSDEVKIVDGMGCREGGSPDCPNQFELYCKDGTYLGPNALMEWKLRRGTGCPCPDGIMGICESTGKTMKCPNGDEPDWFNTRGALEKQVERELKDCRLE